MQAILKTMLAVCAFLLPGIAGAQLTPDPVSWSASAGKRSGKTYEVRISAVLKPGWHIYAMNPGGDGTLIATSFAFGPVPGGGRPATVKPLSKVKAMTFTGVDGTAYVYEGTADFRAAVSGRPGQALELTVGYQSCNDQMCLPPKKKVLTIKLP